MFTGTANGRMICVFLVLLAVLSSTIAWGNDATAAKPPLKPRIACMEIADDTRHGLGVILSNAVSSAVINTNRFTVFEREQLKVVLRELKIQGGTGLFDAKTIQDIGHFAGAQYIVFGEVETLGTDTDEFYAGSRTRYTTRISYSVNLKMADVATGEILVLYHADKRGEKDGAKPDFTDIFQDGAKEIAREFTRQLIGKVPITGKVAAVKHGDDGFILLDIGSDNGVSPCVDFQVFAIKAITTSTGRVISRRELVCVARAIDIAAGTTEIMPGEYQTQKQLFGTTTYWVPKVEMMDAIQENFEVVSIPSYQL